MTKLDTNFLAPAFLNLAMGIFQAEGPQKPFLSADSISSALQVVVRSLAAEKHFSKVFSLRFLGPQTEGSQGKGFPSPGVLRPRVPMPPGGVPRPGVSRLGGSRPGVVLRPGRGSKTGGGSPDQRGP